MITIVLLFPPSPHPHLWLGNNVKNHAYSIWVVLLCTFTHTHTTGKPAESILQHIQTTNVQEIKPTQTEKCTIKLKSCQVIKNVIYLIFSLRHYCFAYKYGSELLSDGGDAPTRCSSTCSWST